MKFFIATFGCRTNQADSAAIRASLLQNEFQETQLRREADLIVINSCTVTHRTDQQVRQLVRRVSRENPAARIIVTGCYAQRDPEVVAEISGVDAVAGNTRKDEILEIFQASLEQPRREGESATVCRDEWTGPRSAELKPAAEIGTRTRPFVKIQDGCDAGCSYCVIPQVRGPSRSAAPEQILAQVRQLVEKGFREIVLTGIHIGSYGMHFHPRYPLDRVLREITQIEGIGRVRLSSIEPMELSRRIIDLAAETDVIAPHFHICVQSGADSVLKRMRRPYVTSRFGEMVREIREKIPGAGIGTDVIVGFPGETEEEHRETVAFVREMPFTYLHVFPYSDRPGTFAASMGEKVRPEIIRRRGQELRSLSAQKNLLFRETFLNRPLLALSLSERIGPRRRGLSGNYLQVKLNSQIPENRLVKGLVRSIEDDYLVLGDEGLEIIK